MLSTALPFTSPLERLRFSLPSQPILLSGGEPSTCHHSQGHGGLSLYRSPVWCMWTDGVTVAWAGLVFLKSLSAMAEPEQAAPEPPGAPLLPAAAGSSPGSSEGPHKVHIDIRFKAACGECSTTGMLRRDTPNHHLFPFSALQRQTCSRAERGDEESPGGGAEALLGV